MTKADEPPSTTADTAGRKFYYCKGCESSVDCFQYMRCLKVHPIAASVEPADAGGLQSDNARLLAHVHLRDKVIKAHEAAAEQLRRELAAAHEHRQLAEHERNGLVVSTAQAKLRATIAEADSKKLYCWLDAQRVLTKSADDQCAAMKARLAQVEANLRELFRLYKWRFELAAEERDPIFGGNVKAKLQKYGRKKKAAWEETERLFSEPLPQPPGGTQNEG